MDTELLISSGNMEIMESCIFVKGTTTQFTLAFFSILSPLSKSAQAPLPFVQSHAICIALLSTTRTRNNISVDTVTVAGQTIDTGQLAARHWSVCIDGREVMSRAARGQDHKSL